jgi:hypothetical protein
MWADGPTSITVASLGTRQVAEGHVLVATVILNRFGSCIAIGSGLVRNRRGSMGRASCVTIACGLNVGMCRTFYCMRGSG